MTSLTVRLLIGSLSYAIIISLRFDNKIDGFRPIDATPVAKYRTNATSTIQKSHIIFPAKRNSKIAKNKKN